LEEPDPQNPDLYIEEVVCRSPIEHRERSLNKLTRTLGALPPSLMDDQPSKSPIFDDYSTPGMFIPRIRHKCSFESDIMSSPITFAPSSNENAPQPEETSTDVDADADSSLETSSQMGEDGSAQSHSSSFPLSSSSPMPRLYVSTHSTSDAEPVRNDIFPDSIAPVAQSGWLVPLDEVVISFTRTGPLKPQSWTGEWNREMKDVIRDLRRL
jgi:hypothetical protein